MKLNKILSIITVLGIVSSSIISCTKTEEINPNDKNSITLAFENKVGDKALVLGTGAYKNASGEDFTITTLNYFISNVSFKKEDGTVVKFPNNYFLVRQSVATSLVAELKDIPAGNYKEVTFTVGVDSLKSISDVSQRIGVLDPASYGNDNMYWAWNSGYIFTKIEGISSVAPTNSAGLKKFEYHVGGFGGRTSTTVNNLRTVTLSLADMATVRANIAPEVHLFVDVAKVFDGVTTLKLATTNVVHSMATATPIANNVAKIFSIDHVHNDVH